MSCGDWPPVTFSQTSGIEVARSGQLQCDCTHVIEWNRQIGAPSCNVVATAERSILPGEAALTGVSFVLTSPSSGFCQLQLGLSNTPDGNKSIEFGVSVEVDRCGLTTLKMNEFNAQACELSCEGDERVTIRLDGAAAHVEYLINDVLVYTSKSTARFPLFCKAINIIRNNIHPKQHVLSGHKWFMRLPAKHLQWSKAMFKIVMLRVVSCEQPDQVTTACVSMSGDELTRLEMAAGRTIEDLKGMLTREIQMDAGELRLLNEDGKLLASTDVWPLQETFLR